MLAVCAVLGGRRRQIEGGRRWRRTAAVGARPRARRRVRRRLRLNCRIDLWLGGPQVQQPQDAVSPLLYPGLQVHALGPDVEPQDQDGQRQQQARQNPRPRCRGLGPARQRLQGVHHRADGPGQRAARPLWSQALRGLNCGNLLGRRPNLGRRRRRGCALGFSSRGDIYRSVEPARIAHVSVDGAGLLWSRMAALGAENRQGAAPKVPLGLALHAPSS